MLKTFLYLSIEIIVGAVILYFNLKVFLLYLFILCLISIHYRAEQLRKIVRAFQFANEIKIMAIMKKLNIGEKIIGEVVDEEKTRSSWKNWKDLLKETEEVMGVKIIDE
jgi:hypothetical protein